MFKNIKNLYVVTTYRSSVVFLSCQHTAVFSLTAGKKQHTPVFIRAVMNSTVRTTVYWLAGAYALVKKTWYIATCCTPYMVSSVSRCGICKIIWKQTKIK